MNIPTSRKRQAFRFVGITRADLFEKLLCPCTGCGKYVKLADMSDRGPVKVRGGIADNHTDKKNYDVDVNNVDPKCKDCQNDHVAQRDKSK